MTTSERVRENPRAVLAANFKRIAEALRSLEEYGKLVDVWLSGRFEVLRYDVYTLEKLTLTAVHAHRAGRSEADGLGRRLADAGRPDLDRRRGHRRRRRRDRTSREKPPRPRAASRAREVRILTAQAKARFILNDRPDLARLAGADGVHVGQDDLSIRDTRRIVGPTC